MANKVSLKSRGSAAINMTKPKIGSITMRMAGLPTRFQSNVTTRNQFSKVLAKPSNNFLHRNLHEVESCEFSQERLADGGEFDRIGSATINPHPQQQRLMTAGMTVRQSHKAGVTSDKDLLA